MKTPIFLNEELAEKVHKASIKVLEKTGVDLNHEEAEELYLKAGAKKDQDGRILIPEGLIEEALEKASSEVQLYDREGNPSLLLKDGNNYFGPGSDALYNIDLDSWEIRDTGIEDIERNVKIADVLDFDFIMSMGLPRDIDSKKLYGTIYSKMIINTSKPMVVTSTSLEDVKQMQDIASIAMGGKDVFREKPQFLAYMEPISPLQMDHGGVERMLYCIENDIPILYAAGANSGTGAPITSEGGVIQGSAESLAGLVLALLKNENAKFVYGANTASMDMKKMIVAYGSPEWAKTVAMYADMGKYYNLPSWGTAACSDAFELNAQAAWEAQESILLAVMSETTMAHDVGYLGHGELYDPRMLVLTDEMIKRARHITASVDMSENSIEENLQVIDEVSRGKEIYPSHNQTFKKFRDVLWLPPDYVFKGLYREYGDVESFNELLKEEVYQALEKHNNRLSEDKVKEIKNYLSDI